jgi:hypothetical protein
VKTEFPNYVSAMGIFTVQFPAGRVVNNVIANAVQIDFITDNVFVIVALPERRPGCAALDIDLSGCD